MLTRLLAIRWPPWLSWLGWLLSTDMGPPGPLGCWPIWLTVLFHGSNFIIGCAFLAIPLVAMRGYKERREGVSPGIVLAAVVLCSSMAASRLARVFELYGPPYRLTTFLDCLAAVTSAYCVWHLYPALKTILKLPSRHEMHEANDRLHAEMMKSTLREAELAESNRVLVAELASLQARLRDKLWYTDRGAILSDIERITTLIPHPESNGGIGRG